MMKKSLNIVLVALFASFLFTSDVFAACPLGPDVTKDLHGLLKIINYLAPLLLIGFSIVDVVKGLTNDDSFKSSKAIVQKFLKRLAYTILLFFIPILVDVFMQMAGVWDSDGGCDFKTTGMVVNNNLFK